MGFTTNTTPIAESQLNTGSVQSEAGQNEFSSKANTVSAPVESDRSLNEAIGQHAAVADWEYAQLHADILISEARFNREFFDGGLPPAAISFESDDVRRLGWYLLKPDGLALNFRININTKHLASGDQVDVLETLLHEMLHLWEHIGGRVKGGRYHTKKFRDKAEALGKKINSAVFPGMQGGPLMHVIAAKAVAFGEALRPEFTDYAKQIIKNAQVMAQEFLNRGYQIVSGGTDNHMMVLDLRNKNLVGKEAEKILEKIGVSVSRSTIPNDPNPPMNPSGLRLGTPAVTTRGMKEPEMKLIAEYIDVALQNGQDEAKLSGLKDEIKAMCARFPIPTK